MNVTVPDPIATLVQMDLELVRLTHESRLLTQQLQENAVRRHALMQSIQAVMATKTYEVQSLPKEFLC